MKLSQSQLFLPSFMTIWWTLAFSFIICIWNSIDLHLLTYGMSDCCDCYCVFVLLCSNKERLCSMISRHLPCDPWHLSSPSFACSLTAWYVVNTSIILRDSSTRISSKMAFWSCSCYFRSTVLPTTYFQAKSYGMVCDRLQTTTVSYHHIILTVIDPNNNISFTLLIDKL